jgi:beta-glucosidase
MPGRRVLRRMLRVLLPTALAVGFSLGTGGSASSATSCPWMNRSLSADQRAEMLLGAMSLSDKISMVHQQYPLDYRYGAAGWIPAIPSLCIPDLVLNDAGQGVGDGQTGTTAFPAPIAQAASWDPALQYDVGAAVGREARQKGIDVWLAPGVEADRVPMNGRNWEYGGEDPYLNGQAGAAIVRGVQSEHVIATLKHYIANSQETDRGSNGPADSADVDERTLEEMYAPQYEAGIKEGGAGSVMCSYNRINGVYSCENPTTIGILDKQFGFTGFVMSDWGATHSTVASAKAGMDMEMNVVPGTYYGSALQSALQNGQVPMSTLNEMVLRILRSMFRIGVFDHPPAAQPQAYSAPVSTPAHVELARRMSEEGTVLLKNQDGILPITGQGQTIAVIGQDAGQAGAENEYNGGGSGHIPEIGITPAVVSPQQAITQRAAADGDTVLYAHGSSTADAVAAAKAAGIAVVFVGDSESEGTDRPDLTLRGGTCTLLGCTPQTVNQDALVTQVAAANPNTVVVLDTGGPVLMPWLNQVKGLFEAWYPGQEDGNAIAALLFGDSDPSGRLTETFPAAQNDIPTQSAAQYPGVSRPGDSVGPHSKYSEGLLVGYRWYDAKQLTPLFPFGFGLDYTTFGYSGMHLAAAPPGDSKVAAVTITVTNTGDRKGADVPQLYVEDPASTGEPPRQLKGFRRVDLAPGASTQVRMDIDARALSWWNPAFHDWTVSRGCYTIAIGHNEGDLTAQQVLAVNGAPCAGAAAAVSILTNTASCFRNQGPVVGSAMGPVRLGMTRAQARRGFARISQQRRRYMDFFCLGAGGIRAGYPSPQLLRTLGPALRRRVSGRVVLILTSSLRYADDGVHRGDLLAAVARHAHLGRPYVVGINRWYVLPSAYALSVLKVRRGVVEEIGIADPVFGVSRQETLAFFRSFS